MDFKEKKEYVKANKKIDIKHFDSVKEVTNMIDFLNNEREKKTNERAEEDIHSISELLARIEKRKIFILKKGL
jgi:hypothetical protein